jgi:hypothetical protein
MSVFRVVPIALFFTTLAVAQQTISFPTEDGGRICADGLEDRLPRLSSQFIKREALCSSKYRNKCNGLHANVGPAQAALQ